MYATNNVDEYGKKHNFRNFHEIQINLQYNYYYYFEYTILSIHTFNIIVKTKIKITTID